MGCCASTASPIPDRRRGSRLDGLGPGRAGRKSLTSSSRDERREDGTDEDEDEDDDGSDGTGSGNEWDDLDALDSNSPSQEDGDAANSGVTRDGHDIPGGARSGNAPPAGAPDAATASARSTVGAARGDSPTSDPNSMSATIAPELLHKDGTPPAEALPDAPMLVTEGTHSESSNNRDLITAGSGGAGLLSVPRATGIGGDSGGGALAHSRDWEQGEVAEFSPDDLPGSRKEPSATGSGASKPPSRPSFPLNALDRVNPATARLDGGRFQSLDDRIPSLQPVSNNGATPHTATAAFSPKSRSIHAHHHYHQHHQQQQPPQQQHTPSNPPPRQLNASASSSSGAATAGRGNGRPRFMTAKSAFGAKAAAEEPKRLSDGGLEAVSLLPSILPPTATTASASDAREDDALPGAPQPMAQGQRSADPLQEPFRSGSTGSSASGGLASQDWRGHEGRRNPSGGGVHSPAGGGHAATERTQSAVTVDFAAPRLTSISVVTTGARRQGSGAAPVDSSRASSMNPLTSDYVNGVAKPPSAGARARSVPRTDTSSNRQEALVEEQQPAARPTAPSAGERTPPTAGAAAAGVAAGVSEDQVEAIAVDQLLDQATDEQLRQWRKQSADLRAPVIAKLTNTGRKSVESWLDEIGAMPSRVPSLQPDDDESPKPGLSRRSLTSNDRILRNLNERRRASGASSSSMSTSDRDEERRRSSRLRNVRGRVLNVTNSAGDDTADDPGLMGDFAELEDQAAESSDNEDTSRDSLHSEDGVLHARSPAANLRRHR